MHANQGLAPRVGGWVCASAARSLTALCGYAARRGLSAPPAESVALRDTASAPWGDHHYVASRAARPGVPVLSLSADRRTEPIDPLRRLPPDLPTSETGEGLAPAPPWKTLLNSGNSRPPTARRLKYSAPLSIEAQGGGGFRNKKKANPPPSLPCPSPNPRFTPDRRHRVRPGPLSLSGGCESAAGPSSTIPFTAPPRQLHRAVDATRDGASFFLFDM